MAITTDNGKLAIMELEDYWEPGLPISPGALGQDDQQQLLWGFPEILWGSAVTLGFVLDMNTRLYVYIKSHYSLTGGDLTTLMQRYLNELSGDMNGRLRKLVKDATDAMT